LEEQIERIYAERVPLKSGGTIVINPTEALVAIDVNSGRSTSQKEIEDTAHKTNLEAAEEVARQLRLRDLGGLIVIDFIDMKDKKHQKEVEQALKASLKKDKARVTVGHLSKFGLLELSRQRLRPTAETSAYIPCPACQGRGRIKKVDTLSVGLLRQISTQAAQGQIQEVRVLAPAEVAHFLLNKKRSDLLNLEEQFGLKIVVTGKEGLGPEEILVEYGKKEGLEPKAAAEAKPAPERKPAAEPPPAQESKAPAEAKAEEKPAPEAQPAAKAKKSGERKRPSRPRRRSSKPKPKAEPKGEAPGEARAPETPPPAESAPAAQEPESTP
jgi:ribonuclease E